MFEADNMKTCNNIQTRQGAFSIRKTPKMFMKIENSTNTKPSLNSHLISAWIVVEIYENWQNDLPILSRVSLKVFGHLFG